MNKRYHSTPSTYRDQCLPVATGFASRNPRKCDAPHRGTMTPRPKVYSANLAEFARLLADA